MKEPMIRRIDLKTQAKLKIQEYIASLDLEKSNKLPREEEFCRIIGVSRITLRSALNELEMEGLIHRRQGKGTFVNMTRRNMKLSFSPVGHFSDVISAAGFTPRLQPLLTEIIPADEKLAAALGINPGDEVIRDKKYFYADDVLCAYCEDHFARSLIGDMEIKALNTAGLSVFHYLYEITGRKVCWDKVDIAAVNTGLKKELALFGDKPLLFLRGTNYDEQDVPLVLIDEYVDTRILTFSQIRQRRINY